MNDDIHSLVGAYAVDALDDAERARFEEHLATCAECRAEVASLRGAAASVAAPRRHPAPRLAQGGADARHRLGAAAAAARGPPGPGPTSSSGTSRPARTPRRPRTRRRPLPAPDELHARREQPARVAAPR